MTAQDIPQDDDAVLSAVADRDAALCTIVGVDGSYSRRRGAHLAICPDGEIVGELADGCLEAELARQAELARPEGAARLIRYGAGSPIVDFRLPCGSGLDILIDPAPDRRAAALAVERLRARQPASLPLPVPGGGSGLLSRREYIPALRILLFGSGPEYDWLIRQARGAGIEVTGTPVADRDRPGLALGATPGLGAPDRWTAVLLLFHDHEWERALLAWALSGDSFYIGAQGGARTRETRREMLAGLGHDADRIARVRSPIGLIRHARNPQVLALSALAEIVDEYERLHPHP